MHDLTLAQEAERREILLAFRLVHYVLICRAGLLLWCDLAGATNGAIFNISI